MSYFKNREERYFIQQSMKATFVKVFIYFSGKKKFNPKVYLFSTSSFLGGLLYLFSDVYKNAAMCQSKKDKGDLSCCFV